MGFFEPSVRLKKKRKKRKRKKRRRRRSVGLSLLDIGKECIRPRAEEVKEEW